MPPAGVPAGAGRPEPAPGDPVSAIDTPALVVDLDALERNLSVLASYARQHGLRLRPHAKTHKCAALARLQIAAGAVGVCVQKLDEAVALARQGIDDLYISNQIVDAAKLDRLARLAGCVRLAIAVDSEAGVDALASALRRHGQMLDVFVEVDIGQGRCGVAPTAAGALAHRVIARGLRFAGVQAYHGGAQHLRTAAQREATLRHAIGAARAAVASITSSGIACPLVTGGGTGSFVHEAESGLYGELQPGSYVFMDRDYADNEPTPHAPRFEQALFLKSQVISRGLAHAVIDAGHKAHALDSGPPRVVDRVLQWSNGGDEHGILRMPEAAPARAAPGGLPGLGEIVWLVPGHCDPTVNLHDRLIAVRGGLRQGRVEAVWPIDACGALG